MRTATAIEQQALNAMENAEPVAVSLDYWLGVIKTIKAAERSLVQTEADLQTYRDRTASLDEAAAWILLLKRYWVDEKGIFKDVPAKDAERLTWNAIRVGVLIQNAKFRLLESSVVDGMDLYANAKRQSEENTGKGFSITRENLLTEMRKAAAVHSKANQERLCEIVAATVSKKGPKPVKGETIRKALQKHAIRFEEYKQKT